MNCKYHSDINGVNTCSKCGDWLCEKCSIEINGRIYCKSCLSKELSGEKTKEEVPPIKHSHKTSKVISPFFTFCFAFIPGCGHMYLGLMKRGLILMALFFGMMYLTSFFDLFLVGAILIYFYSFFDTFNCKNKLLNGEYIKDDIDDLKLFFNSNKKLLGTSVIIIMLLEVFKNFRYSPFGQITSNVLIIAFVIVGIYTIFIKNKKDKN